MSSVISSPEGPVYRVFSDIPNVVGAYTGKGTSRSNHYFSFSTSIPSAVLSDNLNSFHRAIGVDVNRITWPNGYWPHTGQAIIAERYHWQRSDTTGGRIAWNSQGVPVQYDSIVTKSLDYHLGVQGADCPSIFFADEEAGVIGLAHSGWKPTVRGVVKNTIMLMEELHAEPGRVKVFIGPGVGDRYNEFSWGEAMEQRVRQVFEDAGRQELLNDVDLRHVMNEEDRKRVEEATGHDVKSGVSFRLESLIIRDLLDMGVKKKNIEVCGESTICEHCIELEGNGEKNVYKYHSARRDNGKDPDRPGFGSNLCVLQLRELKQSTSL